MVSRCCFSFRPCAFVEFFRACVFPPHPPRTIEGQERGGSGKGLLPLTMAKIRGSRASLLAIVHGSCLNIERFVQQTNTMGEILVWNSEAPLQQEARSTTRRLASNSPPPASALPSEFCISIPSELGESHSRPTPCWWYGGFR